MQIMSTNFAWKHEYDVKLWRHKHRTPNTKGHHMPLNETPMNIFCARHWSTPFCKLAELAQDIVNNMLSGKSVGVKFDACWRSFTYKVNSRGPSDKHWVDPRVTPRVVNLYPQQHYTAVCLANN